MIFAPAGGCSAGDSGFLGGMVIFGIGMWGGLTVTNHLWFASKSFEFILISYMECADFL